MPRKPAGDKALSGSERQAVLRKRKAERNGQLRDALAQIQSTKTIKEAHAIATAALSNNPTGENAMSQFHAGNTEGFGSKQIAAMNDAFYHNLQIALGDLPDGAKGASLYRIEQIKQLIAKDVLASMHKAS